MKYARGQGVAKDESKAVQWWAAAAAQGHVEAQFNLGTTLLAAYYYFLFPFSRCAFDCGLSVELWYQRGQGVGQDDSKAAQWWQAAAMQGHAEAQYYVGMCKRVRICRSGALDSFPLFAGVCCGLGMTKDQSKAVQWWAAAAAQGHAEAQFNLGMSVGGNSDSCPSDF